MITTRQLLTTASRSLPAVPPFGVLAQLAGSAALGWVGLTQRNSRVGTRSALVAAGALLGAGAALLLAPSSGRDLRTRLGKSAGGSIGGQLGKTLGEQAGAHPVRTAQFIEATRERFASKEG